MTAPTILMVEPNPGILIVARNVLTRAGFVVLAVSNARQGLKITKQRRIDLVLLDAREATKEILIDYASARTPALSIVLTVQKGRDGPVDALLEPVVHRGDVEICDVLEKPFPPDRLLRAVEKGLDRWTERTEPFEGDLLDALRVELELRADEVDEQEQTDIFPFAALLQNETRLADESLDRDTHSTYSIRASRVLSRLKSALAERGVPLADEQLEACVTATESVLSEELGRDPMDLESDPASAKLAVAGFIEHLPIDQILQLATSVEGPARCRLEHESSAIEIYYQGGDVLFARHDNLHDAFMLGRLLVSSGMVDQRTLDRSLDPRLGLSGWIGERLVRLGQLSRESLALALRRQSEELVFEAVRWRRGRFAIFAKDPLPAEAEAAGVNLPVHHLLLEGMRRLDEWQRLSGSVGDPSAVLSRLSPEDASERIRALHPDDRLILESIDGHRTVRDLVHALNRPSTEVFRRLHHLADQRLVGVTARGSA
jgi:CheY-like chemotaxis protein